MRANEQDRISLADNPGARSSGRSPVVDIVVLTVVFLVALVVAFTFLYDFEPDYSALIEYSGGGGGAGGGGDSPNTIGAGRSAYDVRVGDRADIGDYEEKLQEPEPPDAAATELFSLPSVSPILQQSDESLLEQLKKLTSLQPIIEWSETQDLARRFVVLVYNLAYGDVAHRYLPMRAPEQPFRATGTGDKLRISAKSYARYDVYAGAINGINPEHAVAIYRLFYPAFRTAFAELGEPRKSLHNELVKAIDHLLETPDIEGDIFLVRPTVYYKFADKKLERLTPAQKQMLRVGGANRALIFGKLEEVKALLLDTDL